MSTPGDEGPQQKWGPPQGPSPQGPPSHQHPPYGPPPPPPPSQGASTGVLVAFAFVGLIVYSVINTVLGFAVFLAAVDAERNSTPIVIAGAVVLALVGLGAGIGLCLVREKVWARGTGLGLMIGWALWSIMTAGICTGLNPSVYG
ncbi:hypothetical protein E1295_27760 [Nonomuraea mesophila]|uniref:DUF4190 domain-containing protein n=1 Tax=Nonomuraea mesophila TaxID=2530382 RepID=A0A4R5F4S4_9ACTN|nr:hypothetical protein [Nonomuraea mesophila]TDE42576.1 hypothetical protein E1295_27760 [Nonomuraea mesophila]